MPFPEGAGGISAGLEQISDRFFLRCQSHLCAGKQCAGDPYPVGIASRHQSRPGSAADSLCGHEVGEAHAFTGHAVEVGGAVVQRAVTGEVAIAQVIHEDEDDIGFSSWGRRGVSGERKKELYRQKT